MEWYTIPVSQDRNTTKCALRCVIEAMILVIVVVSLMRHAKAQPMAVCDVLQNLSEFSGKRITIRGVWLRSHVDQTLESEQPCLSPTIRDGWHFWDTIQLVPDRGAYKALIRRPGEDVARPSPVQLKIIAEFTGKLETRNSFKVRTFPSGEQVPESYGYSVARLTFTGIGREIEKLPWEDSDFRSALQRWSQPFATRVR